MIKKNNQKKLLLMILITVVMILFLACSTNEDKDSQENTTNSNPNPSEQYSKFVKDVHRINKEKFENFVLISQPGVNNVFMTMPETNLDDREKDSLADGSPSKYIFEFTNQKGDLYIRTTFLYYSMNENGILLQSIIVPDTRLERTGDYQNVVQNVPSVLSDLISINGYTVLIESTLLNGVDKGSDEKNTEYLLAEELKFVKELEGFLKSITT